MNDCEECNDMHIYCEMNVFIYRIAIVLATQLFDYSVQMFNYTSVYINATR